MRSRRSVVLAWALGLSVAAARPLRILPLGDSLTYGCGDQCDPAANCTHPPAYRHNVISVLGQHGLKGSHYHPGQSSGYGEVPCSRCSAGYRGELLKLLSAAGQDVELVGNLENDDGNGRHEGHIGWRIDQVTAAIAKPGGIGLGHNGAGGHDVGRHAVPQLRAPVPGWEGRSHDESGVRDYSSMDGGAGWARLQPDVILLHIGTNDIGQGADLDTVVARTRALLDAIFEELPQVQLFYASLVSMLPFGPALPLSNKDVMANFNAELPSLLAEYSDQGRAGKSLSLSLSLSHSVSVSVSASSSYSDADSGSLSVSLSVQHTTFLCTRRLACATATGQRRWARLASRRSAALARTTQPTMVT